MEFQSVLDSHTISCKGCEKIDILSLHIGEVEYPPERWREGPSEDEPEEGEGEIRGGRARSFSHRYRPRSLLVIPERKLSRSESDISIPQDSIINDDERESSSHSTEIKLKGSKKLKDGHKEHSVKVPHIISRLLKNKKQRRPKSETGKEDASSCSLRSAVRVFDTNQVVRLVANREADINGARENGITALHEAAIDGNINCVKVLVDHGAGINMCDSEGFTPLDYAVFGGNFECAAYLIENGAREDRIRDGQILYQEDLRRSRRATFS